MKSEKIKSCGKICTCESKCDSDDASCMADCHSEKCELDCGVKLKTKLAEKDLPKDFDAEAFKKICHFECVDAKCLEKAGEDLNA